jgi:hypothetical protein
MRCARGTLRRKRRRPFGGNPDIHGFTSVADLHAAGPDRALGLCTPRETQPQEAAAWILPQPCVPSTRSDEDRCKGEKGFGTLRNLGWADCQSESKHPVRQTHRLHLSPVPWKGTRWKNRRTALCPGIPYFTPSNTRPAGDPAAPPGHLLTKYSLTVFLRRHICCQESYRRALGVENLLEASRDTFPSN